MIFFFQAEDGIRDRTVTGVQTCALPIYRSTLTHVTPEVVPPALAIAERDGRSGRDLLVALAAGFEVTTRVGIGLDYPAFREIGRASCRERMETAGLAEPFSRKR